jgi:hypothetical protein
MAHWRREGEEKRGRESKPTRGGSESKTETYQYADRGFLVPTATYN